ncbi:hypothetical protein ACWD4G_31300 [Streptomyces sp. NPDC002643]
MAGPLHIAFHSHLPYAYTIDGFRLDARRVVAARIADHIPPEWPTTG